MIQKPVDLKGKKILRSIELHPDLKPDAIKRLLNELSADAIREVKRKAIIITIHAK